jgi:hypothetical protein
MRKSLFALTSIAALALATSPAFADKSPSMKSSSPAPAPVVQTSGVQASIFPTLLGPIGAAALAGSTTSTFFTSHFAGWKFSGIKWVKIHHKWVKIPKFDAKYKKVGHTSKSNMNMGKAVVGCVFFTAFGKIVAAAHKGAINGSLYLRTQKEWEDEVAAGIHLRDQLTQDESDGAGVFCGLGSLGVVAGMQPKSQQEQVHRVSN